MGVLFLKGYRCGDCPLYLQPPGYVAHLIFAFHTTGLAVAKQGGKPVKMPGGGSARAGFFRRMAAMIYDTLVAVAVAMCSAMVLIVTLIIALSNQWLSLQGYSDPASLIQNSWHYKLGIQIWVSCWVVGFFLWFWANGGQTIGMRAWRLRIFSTLDEPVTWKRLIIRLIFSFGGIGTLLVLVDRKHRQSLQDRMAHTEVLFLSKQANDHKSW